MAEPQKAEHKPMHVAMLLIEKDAYTLQVVNEETGRWLQLRLPPAKGLELAMHLNLPLTVGGDCAEEEQSG